MLTRHETDKADGFTHVTASAVDSRGTFGGAADADIRKGRMTDDAIRFPAEIVKVQTMADGAIRLTLDLPAGEIGTAAKLMEAKQRLLPLQVAAVAVEENEVKKGFSLRN